MYSVNPSSRWTSSTRPRSIVRIAHSPTWLSADFIRRLHQLHNVDRQGRMQPEATDATHVQIDRWPDIYRPHADSPMPLIEEAAAWLRRHAPALDRPAIVHGDPGPGNFFHDGAAVVAFTDWEFAHLGDPIEDWVYLISMRGARTMTAGQWCRQIRDTAGTEVTDWDLRYWERLQLLQGGLRQPHLPAGVRRPEPGAEHGDHRQCAAADVHAQHGATRRRAERTCPVTL